jgi:hypothetical protein
MLELPEEPGVTPQQMRNRFPDDMGKAEGRTEALFVRIEHVALPKPEMWRAKIERNPTRVLPWQEGNPDDATGRMVGLVDWRS